MNCVVVDDEELPRKILEQLISLEPALNLLVLLDSPVDALKYINSGENQIDLIFLDIVMPDFTGFDFIKSVKSNAQIIFVSSDKNYALKAFELSNATDYLLKPIQKERFQKAVSKAIKKHQNTSIINKDSETKSNNTRENDLYVTIDKRLIKINIPDINIIEAEGNFIKIKTSTDTYLIYSSLKKIEEKLPASLFMRVHRSFIINLRRIIDIQDNSILVNKELIPVSRRYKNQLFSRLNLL
ncbi:LytTR family DNA-binding domain-containing protein [Gramella sp. MAR_2010_147]|uniref:LytR/AlgR family response regulator transcription factor n=1 Tax=Gramella sp. MAR_2010_147 TaxID=1250205 RepID=UPI0008795F3C|nr:LytTR family DNA-binding domain-containing protein [Gramella sp. MAR_2010_147]SDR77025.1 DNA-binding response regulator, LytR/AlgR family [Gramella sp. MAR_2010_147]